MTLFDKVVSLAKRRGFIYPGSEIYGGLANTYDYGPLGVELLRNIRNLWWEFFVIRRPDMLGLETSTLMSPKVWEASGHTSSFADSLVDCKNCQNRTRADHLIEDGLKDVKVEGKSGDELDKLISDHKLKCPVCGASDWTRVREFNLLFETKVGIVPENQSTAYLRGETAQGMFVNFKNVLDTVRPRIPFGLAQNGKAFRNEITMGQQVFRTLEFDLAEFEYFIEESQWESQFEYWKAEVEKFAKMLGVKMDNTAWRGHTKDELSHYSKRTEDLEYKFEFGSKEWFAVAYRTDFDLRNHMEKSGVDLTYTDPKTNKKFIPHVIEPTFGLSRTMLVVLTDAYYEEQGEKKRVVLKLDPKLAPYKAAVFPLLSNKPELVEKARGIFDGLIATIPVAWDDRGNIGKRYFSQDEVGTPFCITVDFDTMKDDTVTVRERDSAKQERVGAGKLEEYIGLKLNQ